jgi:hypothetical protein
LAKREQGHGEEGDEFFHVNAAIQLPSARAGLKAKLGVFVDV